MRDLEPKVEMEVLDPGYENPGYWRNFQARVMMDAGPYLAARRRQRITVEGVMVSWSRMILPALVAAGIAALLLTNEPQAGGVAEVAGIEEVLDRPVDGEEPLPSFLHSDEIVDRNVVLLAVEQF